jgi:hypothetical protein
MRLRPTGGATRSMRMRRDVRYVERKLREFTRPRKDDVLDISRIRNDVQRWVDAIPPGRVDDALYEDIDKLIDTYVADFLSGMRERHHAELAELGHLKGKVLRYLSPANDLMNDQKDIIEHLNMVVTHALDRLADAETPLTDPRHRAERRDDPQ